MAIKCEEYNQVCVMSVEGDFAHPDVESARKLFDERIEKHHIVDFVVDLEKSEFIDSEGLELLLVSPSDRSVPFYGRAGFQPAGEWLQLTLPPPGGATE